jgi:hypothetical protein
VLGPLIDLAAELKIAIIAIMHFYYEYPIRSPSALRLGTSMA